MSKKENDVGLKPRPSLSNKHVNNMYTFSFSALKQMTTIFTVLCQSIWLVTHHLTCNILPRISGMSIIYYLIFFTHFDNFFSLAVSNDPPDNVEYSKDLIEAEALLMCKEIKFSSYVCILALSSIICSNITVHRPTIANTL